jgi:hypothetical protein
MGHPLFRLPKRIEKLPIGLHHDASNSPRCSTTNPRGERCKRGAHVKGAHVF